jgi:hypothetical protein
MNMLNWFMTALVVAITAIITYWAQDRRPPVQIIEEAVETPFVPVGGSLRVRFSINREKVCHVHLEQFIYDSRRGRFVLPDEDYQIAPGIVGRDEFVSVIQIPRAFLPGRARYRAIRAYYCNPIHTWLSWPIVVVAPEVEFEVVETKPQVYENQDAQKMGDEMRRGIEGPPRE